MVAYLYRLACNKQVRVPLCTVPVLYFLCRYRVSAIKFDKLGLTFPCYSMMVMNNQIMHETKNEPKTKPKMLVKTYYFQINKSFKKTTYTIILSESITSMDDIIWKDINYRKQIFSSHGLKLR